MSWPPLLLQQQQQALPHLPLPLQHQTRAHHHRKESTTHWLRLDDTIVLFVHKIFLDYHSAFGFWSVGMRAQAKHCFSLTARLLFLCNQSLCRDGNFNSKTLIMCKRRFRENENMSKLKLCNAHFDASNSIKQQEYTPQCLCVYI